MNFSNAFMHLSRLSIGGLLVAALGCEEPAASPRNGWLVRDSAGITIVRLNDPLWQTRASWRLLSDPLSLPSVSQSLQVQVFGVMDVLARPAGRLALANRGTAELFVLERSGNGVVTIGQRGQGPGEFAAVYRLFDCANDTMVVVEGARLGFVTPSGRAFRKVPMPQLTPVPRIVEGVSSDCSSVLLLGGEAITEPYPMSPFRQDLVLYWRAIDSADVDTVVRFNGPQRAVVEFGARRLPLVIPWSDEPAWFVTNDDLVFGTGDEAKYIRVGRDGRLTQIVEWLERAQRIDDRDRAAFSRQRDNLRRSDPGSARFLPALSSFPSLPDHKPVYDKILGDALGNIWIREYPGYAAGLPGFFDVVDSLTQDLWWVFTASGEPISAISTPARLDIKEITEDEVIGVWRDSLNVESVRVYRLAK